MEPLGSTKGSTNAYQHPYISTCPVALTEVEWMTAWPSTLLLDPSSSQKHCFCVCVCVCHTYVYICTSNICIIVHTNLSSCKQTLPLNAEKSLPYWYIWSDEKCLQVSPRCYSCLSVSFCVHCQLISFTFFQSFVCSWSLPLPCFSPSPIPSNLFVCQILHCIFFKIFRQIVWGSACIRYFTQNAMVQWF